MQEFVESDKQSCLMPIYILKKKFLAISNLSNNSLIINESPLSSISLFEVK